MNALFRSRTHRRSTTFGAGLEPLEGRALLSVSVTPLTAPATTALVATQATTNKDSEGAATQIPALFNGQSVTINVVQLSDNAAASIMAHNKGLPTIIYVTNDLDDHQDFNPVINAVQGQGFNALWLQEKIVFNPGVTPHQFTSEADILAAAKPGPNQQITLINTGEVYRDSVVGGTSHA